MHDFIIYLIYLFMLLNSCFTALFYYYVIFYLFKYDFRKIMVERATWWVSSGPCAHGNDWVMDPILLMVKLGRVPRWMPLLSGTASDLKGNWDGCLGGCLCSRGPPVYMMRLGWVPRWMPLLSGTASVWVTGMGASVDAFALGDRQ